MKHLHIIAGILLAGCLGLWACKKNELTVTPFDFTEGKALLKINYVCPYFNNPPVQIKINGEKVSSLITYATPYPGGGLNTGGNTYADYLSVRAGQDTISLSIPKAGTNIDSVLLYKTAITVQANVYQTLHITDTTDNTQSVLITDPSNKPDSGRVQYRFVNLIPNSTGIDLYFGTTRVASNLAYKAATDTFSLPSGTSMAWSLRTAGGTATVGTAYTNVSSVANQRVFTIFARGYLGLATTDIRSPKVSLAYNK